MSDATYNVIAPETGVPAKAWTKGVPPFKMLRRSSS